MAPQVYRRREVEKLTGLSRSTLYEQMAKGRFPRPVRLTQRAVAWRAEDVAEWLASRPTADAETAN